MLRNAATFATADQIQAPPQQTAQPSMASAPAIVVNFAFISFRYPRSPPAELMRHHPLIPGFLRFTLCFRRRLMNSLTPALLQAARMA